MERGVAGFLEYFYTVALFFKLDPEKLTQVGFYNRKFFIQLLFFVYCDRRFLRLESFDSDSFQSGTFGFPLQINAFQLLSHMKKRISDCLH